MQLPGSESLLKPGIVVQGWLLQTSELLQMNLKNIPPFSHHPNILMTKCAPWRLMVGVGGEESGEGRVGGGHSLQSTAHRAECIMNGKHCRLFHVFGLALEGQTTR